MVRVQWSEVTGAPTTLEKVLLADFGEAKQLMYAR
jgi:hypothetical protein